MRASLIIAAHNESDRLWRTVASCVETSAGLDCEIVVADDASWDDSVEETLRRFPQVRVIRHVERKGASPTKDLGARHARGDTLIFLDGHTKPETGAIQRLIEDVERLKGDAIITPSVTGLCVTRWKSLDHQKGHGLSLELERLDSAWLPLSALRQHRHQGRLFYESPGLSGCAFAVHRELYDDLRGFDPHMLFWGVEDLDFGLKCWLMGHPILHDPEPVIGHRFQQHRSGLVRLARTLPRTELGIAGRSPGRTLGSRLGVVRQTPSQCGTGTRPPARPPSPRRILVRRTVRPALAQATG